jgi:hypothetical protein
VLSQVSLNSSILQQFFSIVRRRGFVLFLIGFIGTFFDQWIVGSLEELIRSPDGVDYRIWIFGSLSILNSILFPTLFFVVLFNSLSDQAFWTGLKNTYLQSIKEVLRVWGKSFLWSFLLILPGFLKYLRSLFVPLIVCLDSEYAEGRIDALEKSGKVSKGMFTALLGLAFVFFLIIPMLLTLVDEYRLISTNPISGSMISCFNSMIEIFFWLLVLKLFRRKVTL